MNYLIRLVLILTFASADLSVAASPSTAELAPFLKVVQRHFKAREARLKSGAVVVTYQGNPVYLSTFGARRNGKGPITESTLFPLASVSKSISAVLALYLSKQGKIAFTDQVSESVKEVDPRIQLKHVLSHTSGYNDQFGNKLIESGQSWDQIIQVFKNKIPENPPGKSYSYSNIIFSFMEKVIQNRTQIPYDQNLRNFLSKIGIEGEEICHVVSPDRVAYPHNEVHKKRVAKSLPNFYSNSVCSAAGVFLSINHMVKVLSLLTGQLPDVLTSEDLKILYEHQVEVTEIFKKWPIFWPFPLNELKSYYGLGWRVLEWKNEATSRIVFHSGHLSGISTFLGFLPEKQIGLAILSNQDATFTEGMALDFWKDSMAWYK